MILLLDLHERPLAPEAPRSRVFVDEIFSLFSDHPGEAWRMLGRLRRRAEGNIAATPKSTGVNIWEGEAGWDWNGWTGEELSLMAAGGQTVVQIQEEVQQQQTLQQLQEEFDLKEWDQVFGRFVEMEDQRYASPGASWGLMDAE
jgi:hypothetical protein